MNDDRNFVDVQYRPRRVAFLVDVDQCPDALIDEIVDFNISAWGGRYNPIVPVLAGQIPDSYWRLLELANPDILYAYCDLSTAAVKRIQTDIRPMDVMKHNLSLQPNSDQFRVRIDHQASVLPVLRHAMAQFPVFARTPEPAILSFDYNDFDKVSSFVQRNFGASSNVYFWCRDRRIPPAQLPPDDTEVMKALAGNANILLPINICADAPRKFKASTEDLTTALTICYGISPWNFVEFWNLAHFQDGSPPGVQMSLSKMWMPPALLEDRSSYEAFIELIRRRVSVSGHQSRLRLISYDEPDDRMREVTKRICEDFKWNMHQSDPITKTKGELPAFEARRVFGFFAPLSSQPHSEQVSGKSSFIELDHPIDAPRDRDERWIAEFAVENSQQERYFVNKTAWWKLPRKGRVANLFFPHSPCRVGNDHLICAEVSGQQQGVLLKVPDLKSLFDSLVLPGAAPEWAHRLDPARPRDVSGSLYIRSSDKGKYARGVLGLFESLQKAAYVFEHDFWRGVIESLSMPSASEHTRNKVRSDLERIGIDALKSAFGIDQIVDEVLDAAGRIQRPTHHTNFKALFGRYLAYIKTLPKDDQMSEITETDRGRSASSDEDEIRNSASANLRDMLSELTARKVFLQGAEIQCDHCLASLWYHVDELRSTVACRGCRKDVNLPAEVPWSYALNELVISAVRDHGVVPVIRTASRLFHESKECFCFLPGIEIRDYRTEPETQVCELDLVWIRDGEFGIAETKRTAKKFSVGDKLARILGTAAPDRFLLVSTSGTDEQMREARSVVLSKIDPSISVEAWDPVIFSRSPHQGWNSYTYSILG